MVKAKIKQSSRVRMISTLQLKKGLSREESTFMAIPLVDKQMETGTILVEIQNVLNEYIDIMPPELPKTLPP
ncbi:reverse transcriptase [Cucumis melo var. makuwa]|uniref:Reverse transcriptase n=1 Tax=Cucumis melo var. makuwa TaxID=1194695 RepID=A0A5A7V8W6_CUCMM|nr:reverse transcriptase [Cucumis melo var. makuwa]